jgi:Leucine-rich repeat (LRR) protein
MDGRFKMNLLYDNGGGIKQIHYATIVTDEVFKATKLFVDLIPIMPPKNIEYQNELEDLWLNLLPHLKKVKHLILRHRVDQTFFEAVCEMKNVECLEFWSSTAKDISSICRLSKLKKLYLDSFSQLRDISPLQNLPKLNILSISSCFKVENYEIIGKLRNLIGLGIHGQQVTHKNLRLKSLEPFANLNNLRHLDLSSTAILDGSYLTLLKMNSLARFDTNICIPKSLRDKLKTHPKLQAGFSIDWDSEKNRFQNGKEWSI